MISPSKRIQCHKTPEGEMDCEFDLAGSIRFIRPAHRARGFSEVRLVRNGIGLSKVRIIDNIGQLSLKLGKKCDAENARSL